MAKATKRRRTTKHRGNAAGMIETRGRTGRKPTAQEKRSPKAGGRAGSGTAKKPNRLDQPPTWRASFQRAMLGAVLVFGFSTLLLKMPLGSTAALLPVVLLIYVPLGYYTDLFVYRRRQRAKVRA